MPEIGITKLFALFLVIFLIFGAKRLPEIGRSLGKGIQEFKQALLHLGSEDERK